MALGIAYYSHMKRDIVDKIVRKAGGASKLAQTLGIKGPSIYSWKRVPADRVIAISQITGISPHEIRPDVFPAPLKGSP